MRENGRVNGIATKWRRPGAALGLLTLLLPMGCRTPDEGVRTESPSVEGASRVQARRFVIGRSVEGRPIECMEFGKGEEVVLILASIHGSEAAGTPLLRRLAQYIVEHAELVENRRVVMIPVANPDGVGRGMRHNARDVDLNRNFPASNYESDAHHGGSILSEPESRAIHTVMETCRPSRIITFHQPLACIDYDGPAEALAEAMAAHTSLPVRKLGARPGSLGSYAGVTLGVPIVTVELPHDAGNLDEAELWNRYGGMLLAAVRFPEPVFAEAAEAAE